MFYIFFLYTFCSQKDDSSDIYTDIIIRLYISSNSFINFFIPATRALLSSFMFIITNQTKSQIAKLSKLMFYPLV